MDPTEGGCDLGETDLTDTPCIEWEGTRNKGGYGVLAKPVHGSRLAHRAALAERLGRPVEGVSRHTCDNPPCVNPDHVVEGSQAQNMADAKERGRARGGRYDQTECSKGHPLEADNVFFKKNPECRSGYERVCRTCRTAHNKKQAARRKAARHERGLLVRRKESDPSPGKLLSPSSGT